jgi:hypothetical protein
MIGQKYQQLTTPTEIRYLLERWILFFFQSELTSEKTQGQHVVGPWTWTVLLSSLLVCVDVDESWEECVIDFGSRLVLFGFFLAKLLELCSRQKISQIVDR